MSIYAYHLLKGLGLSEPRVVRLLSVLRTQNLDSDEVIWPKGSFPSAWVYIETGLVSACVPATGESALAPINIYGQGTWFGEAAILSHQALNHEYVCLTPSRVICVPLADAMDAFDNEPEFARYIARLVAWRNQQHSEMLSLMRVGNPQLRVVMGLALFAEALNSSASHLPTSGNHYSLDIPLKQAVLASLCGVSRGIFSECVQQLAAEGWLRLNYATLSLLNVDAWERFSRRHRQTRLTPAKPTMADLLPLMREASPASA
jgi:CRP/FNR family transcriptional regulator, cyclic AMP receptor protein